MAKNVPLRIRFVKGIIDCHSIGYGRSCIDLIGPFVAFFDLDTLRDADALAVNGNWDLLERRDGDVERWRPRGDKATSLAEH